MSKPTWQISCLEPLAPLESLIAALSNSKLTMMDSEMWFVRVRVRARFTVRVNMANQVRKIIKKIN